jgi:hypothetical protein
MPSLVCGLLTWIIRHNLLGPRVYVAEDRLLDRLLNTNLRSIGDKAIQSCCCLLERGKMLVFDMRLRPTLLPLHKTKLYIPYITRRKHKVRLDSFPWNSIMI